MTVTFGKIQRWGTAESLRAPAENGRSGVDRIEIDEDSAAEGTAAIRRLRAQEETAAVVEQTAIFFLGFSSKRPPKLVGNEREQQSGR